MGWNCTELRFSNLASPQLGAFFKVHLVQHIILSVSPTFYYRKLVSSPVIAPFAPLLAHTSFSANAAAASAAASSKETLRFFQRNSSQQRRTSLVNPLDYHATVSASVAAAADGGSCMQCLSAAAVVDGCDGAARQRASASSGHRIPHPKGDVLAMYDPPPPPTQTCGQVYAVGDNSFGELGLDQRAFKVRPPPK
jgi:hypothetical protein